MVARIHAQADFTPSCAGADRHSDGSDAGSPMQRAVSVDSGSVSIEALIYCSIVLCMSCLLLIGMHIRLVSSYSHMQSQVLGGRVFSLSACWTVHSQ